MTKMMVVCCFMVSGGEDTDVEVKSRDERECRPSLKKEKGGGQREKLKILERPSDEVDSQRVMYKWLRDTKTICLHFFKQVLINNLLFLYVYVS